MRCLCAFASTKTNSAIVAAMAGRFAGRIIVLAGGVWEGAAATASAAVGGGTDETVGMRGIGTATIVIGVVKIILLGRETWIPNGGEWR